MTGAQNLRLVPWALTLTCAAIAALALTSVAQATPQVSVKAKIVPIPVNPNAPKKTYPKTGNILGAPAALETQTTIKGNEYFGGPSPIVSVVAYLPNGVKLNPKAFSICSKAILESHEVQKCPRKSIASPLGEVQGMVSFGSSRVFEKATVQAFFSAGNKLAFFAEGREPALIEVLSTGGFSTASKPFGQKLSVAVPLVATVPEAPYASEMSIKIKIGAAYMKSGKLISYGTVPKTCPKGGFPGKVELKFFSGETVTNTIKVPCPKK
ncbi:MAG TPA: hypothetical protein VGY30_03550 [Solirubrobacteraceae bacterium]|jgi:hypothetical protein|nr:hypothetical protein [Solirubrobacteraceae bacterium]